MSSAILIEPAPPEVKRYQRQKLLAAVGSTTARFAILVILAFVAGPMLDRFWRSWIGEDRWLRLAALALSYGAVLELVSFPFAFWSTFLLEHWHRLSNLTWRRWLWNRVKGLLVGGPFALALLLGLYALLWHTGAWWWLWAALGWLAVTLLLGRLVPLLILPLFYRVTPLDAPELLDRLRRLAEGTGLSLEGIFQLDLSAETQKANAALTGLGKSRRILLGDTLLRHFTPEEIEVIFAHELGHHVFRHLPKLVAWEVVLTAGTFLLAELLLRPLAPALGYAGLEDPAALPLFGLVLGLVALLTGPVEGALSRAFERQCDRYALARTGLVAAYRSVFVKLARRNRIDPAPHPLLVWLFHDHPPLRERLALADEFGLPRPV